MKRHVKISRLLTYLIAMWTVGGCATTQQWQSSHYTDHALVGSTWDLHSGQQITRSQLAQRLSETDFLMVGEVHDNLDHHELQRQLLQSWLEQGVRPALVFEQFDQSQQATIDEYRDDLDRLREEAGFDTRGWNWDAYLPLLNTAQAEQLAIYGGNLSREELRAISSEGAPAELDALLQPCLLPVAEQTLKSDIAVSHCDMLDAAMIDRMFAAQRLRDASLASVLIRAGKPAMLIAGNGHVRLDYGVGQILSLKPVGSLLSVGLVEVHPDSPALGDYTQLFVDGVPIFDVVIFTPRVRDEDPCETFREQLEKIKHGKPSSSSQGITE